MSVQITNHEIHNWKKTYSDHKLDEVWFQAQLAKYFDLKFGNSDTVKKMEFIYAFTNI